jgi:sigma-B regulation protein RsbU (phosphoserine phosphatase)
MSADQLIAVGYLLAGGFLVFLAITITRDNFANRLNRITGAMLFFAGLGPVAMALGEFALQGGEDAGFYNSALYNLRHIWEFFFPCLVMFSLAYPVDRLGGVGRSRWRYLIFLPPFLHVLIVLFAPQILGALDSLSLEPGQSDLLSIVIKPLDKLMSWLGLAVGAIRTYQATVFGLINLAYVGVAMYFLETGAREVSNPSIQVQTRWVLWGIRIGLGLFIVALVGHWLLPDVISTEPQAVLMILGLLFGATLFVLATIRHQFLDVQMVFRQSFVTTVTSAVLVGAYILLVVQARDMLTPVFGNRADMVSYGLIIVMLLMFQPISNWLDDLIKTMFIRSRADHRNVLERFSRQVISQFNPSRLRNTIEDTLKTTLLVDRVYFCMFDDELEEYALLPSEDYPRRYVIDRDDLMLRGINLLQTPTFYDSLAEYRHGSDLAAVLEGRGVRMILPLKDAEHLLGFVGLTRKAAGYRFSSEDMNLLGVLSNQMVTALTNARLYVESVERLRLQEEINMARQIQLDLLPSKPPELQCGRIFSTSTPSRTVGGDFYDFLPMPDGRVGMVIADASGKGMPAALLIAQMQAIIRNEVSNGNPISSMLKRANQQITEATSAEKYVTLFYAELDPRNQRLHYANAGHNWPILVRANGTVEQLKVGGPIIGAFPFMEYESASLSLKQGDVLFMFTDGLSEAMDAQEREYGEERIAKIVHNYRHLNPDDLVRRVLADVRAYDPTDPPRDDTTIVALKLTNGVEIHEQKA